MSREEDLAKKATAVRVVDQPAHPNEVFIQGSGVGTNDDDVLYENVAAESDSVLTVTNNSSGAGVLDVNVTLDGTTWFGPIYGESKTAEYERTVGATTFVSKMNNEIVQNETMVFDIAKFKGYQINQKGAIATSGQFASGSR